MLLRDVAKPELYGSRPSQQSLPVKRCRGQQERQERRCRSRYLGHAQLAAEDGINNLPGNWVVMGP